MHTNQESRERSRSEVRMRRWFSGACDVVVVSLAVSGACLLVSGCGQRDNLHSSYTSSTTQSVESQAVGAPPQPASGDPGQSLTAVPASSQVLVGSKNAGGSTETQSLPPEIAVSIADTLVQPGAGIEITAEGTPDVTEMVLWDGLNDAQAFYHDSSRNEWKVSYRVPLRPRQERIGLSVTAKNEAGRWRRVWVFLHVGPVVGANPQPVEGEDS